MRALVVIDMQKEFSDTAEPIIPKVVQQIKRAKKENYYIILVKYAMSIYGPAIYKELLDAVRGYKKSKIINKDNDDGSREVSRTFANQRNISVDICGVNLSACVSDTAYGLVKYKKFREVNIIVNACNDTPSGQRYANAEFNKYPHSKLNFVTETSC